MPSPVIVAYNNTALDVPLVNLGVTVPGSDKVTLTISNTPVEIRTDEDLLSKIEAGTLSLSVDNVTLTATQASSYLGFGSLSATLPKTSFSSSTPPTSSDDANLGFDTGSLWLDTSTDIMYVCVDPTVGSAVWKIVSDTNIDSFGAYDSLGGQTFTGTVTVNLNASRFSSSNYSLSANTVTVATAGTYWISFMVSTEVTSNTRTQGQCWVELNNVEIAGTRGELYNRLLNEGASAGHSFPLVLAANDVLRLRATRTKGTGTLRLETNGSSLSLMKIR